jgi:hypothetical protein
LRPAVGQIAVPGRLPVRWAVLQLAMCRFTLGVGGRSGELSWVRLEYQLDRSCWGFDTRFTSLGIHLRGAIVVLSIAFSMS